MRALTATALALALAALATASHAKPVSFSMPADTSTLQQRAGDGYPRTEALCGSCHSRDYISTQPPKQGKDFWAAEVTKMITVYGAPIPEPDRAPIIDYLTATY